MIGTPIKKIILGLLLLGSSLFQNTSWAQDTESKSTRIPHIQIVDSINAGVQLRIERGLATAREWKSPALFIELDTPGGYLEVTRHIVQSFLESNDVHIVVYVTPQGARAASAGSMITMAAHYAAMAPSTSIGAATPVSGGGGAIEGDIKKKVTNDTLAFVEGIAEKRGRDKKFSRNSITEAASLTSSAALKNNVIDGVFESREDVWTGVVKKYPALPATIEFVTLEMNLKEKAMSLLSNPNIAYGLMALGSLGLYLELSSPGLIVPGLIGVTALALGAFSTQIIPIQTGSILMLVLGIIFLGIEVLTPLPTYGVAGAASLVMFLMSGIFLMDMEQGNIHLDAGIWIPIFLVSALAVGLLSFYAFKAIKSKSKISNQGVDGMLGLMAKVSRLHEDHLSISLMNEVWHALPANNLPLSSFNLGDDVEVVAQEGLKIIVKKKEGVN